MIPHCRNEDISIHINLSWIDVCFRDIAARDVINPGSGLDLPGFGHGVDPVLELLLHALCTLHQVENFLKIFWGARIRS